MPFAKDTRESVYMSLLHDKHASTCTPSRSPSARMT